MRKVLLCLLLSVSVPALAKTHGSWCGTPSPTAEAAPWVARLTEQALRARSAGRTWRIPIAFHVITDGKNGKLSSGTAAALVDNLNWAYRDTAFSFYLAKFDTTKNKAWYKNCYFSTANRAKLRKKLAQDVRYYLNVYSCKLGQPEVYGIATFPPGFPVPGTPGLNYLQGIAIDPITAGGSEQFEYGLALAHEVGHYLGLFHTFERFYNPGQEACADPGDFIPDTPTVAGPTFGACPIGLDSCPALAGLDDIPNFMNYATDACWDHFSPQQSQVLEAVTEEYRPTLQSQ